MDKTQPHPLFKLATELGPLLVFFFVNSKFNLAGTFGVLHYRTSVPTVFGDDAVGEPIGGSSNPGSGHGNTYRFTVMGTYIFTPNFLMDAHFGWAKQGTNSEQPGLGTNIGSDVLGIPGTNGPRAVNPVSSENSRWAPVSRSSGPTRPFGIVQAP